MDYTTGFVRPNHIYALTTEKPNWPLNSVIQNGHVIYHDRQTIKTIRNWFYV